MVDDIGDQAAPGGNGMGSGDYSRRLERPAQMLKVCLIQQGAVGKEAAVRCKLRIAGDFFAG